MSVWQTRAGGRLPVTLICFNILETPEPGAPLSDQPHAAACQKVLLTYCRATTGGGGGGGGGTLDNASDGGVLSLSRQTRTWSLNVTLAE